MLRSFVLLAAAIAFAAACSRGRLDAEGLEERLEARGLESESVFDARCRPGVRGWHYVCTFRLGRRIAREQAAFMVGPDRIKTSSAPMALDLSVQPAPGSPDLEPWTFFVQSATAICGKRRKEIAALASSQRASGLVQRLALAARIQNVELLQLQALSPPAGAENRRLFSELLAGESDLLSASARFRAAADRGNADAARTAASDLEVSARRLDRIARALHLPQCGQTR